MGSWERFIGAHCTNTTFSSCSTLCCLDVGELIHDMGGGGGGGGRRGAVEGVCLCVHM